MELEVGVTIAVFDLENEVERDSNPGLILGDDLTGEDLNETGGRLPLIGDVVDEDCLI